MWHKFYKWISPRSRVDLVFKVMIFLGLIIIFNVAFNRISNMGPKLSLQYLILNGLIVGGPFVASFFLILIKQAGLQKSLVRLSRFDHLTNLPNRRFFMKSCAEIVEKDAYAVLLVLDIDNFKAINDTWGHEVGDECLRSVGYILARTLRVDDLVGRLGGEEFGILLRNTRISNIGYIKTALLRPFPFKSEIGPQNLSVTVSIGACEIPKGGDLAVAFRSADSALYKAKRSGKARLEVQEMPPTA
ncbi:GGDEF domain-containing protein [Roseicyclus marinus]|uniref:GGDEF domain-containing protein n=1 Tax=Roseicyclus marinus TaxID=2161673 RepID=UPI00240F365B|nr:GGDEF domain-containing protein [Roseicyclus marinus]MDG3040520.1 GGDEF domain-containing protein [Roseicyclus marinus]